MAEELKPNPTQATSHEAQLAAENMVEGKEQTPKIDVSADYEASKAFSVSQLDRTAGGARAAEAATAHKFEVAQPEQTEYKAETTGNPDNYLDMARDVNPRAEGATNVTDDLVQKALEKGQAAQ